MQSQDYAKTYVRIQMLEALTSTWTFTTYVLFILSTGSTLLDANIANTVFMMTNFLLDPLTGKWGDLYGYRRIYLAGMFIWGISMFSYSLGFSLIHFCIAECLAGVGKALMSEALESWVENSVTPEEAIFIKAKGDTNNRLVTIFCAIAGGFIGAVFGLRWNWVISGFFSFAVLVIAWRMLSVFPREVHLIHQTEKPITVRKGWQKSFASPHLRYLLVFTAVVFVCIQPLNMFYASLFKQLANGNSSWIGLVWIGIALAIAKGSDLTKHVTKVGKWHFIFILLATALPILLASSSNILVVVVAGFIVHELPRGMIRNFSYTYANPHIEKSERSTLNSVRSAVSTFAAIGGLVPSGIASQYLSIQEVWLLSVSILLIYAGILWLIEEVSS